MQSLLVKDYMLNDATVISDTANAAQAVQLLLKHQSSGAPVVDANKQLIGFLSEQDCIRHLINASYYCEEPPNVKEVMVANVISVSPATSVLEVAEMMIKKTPKVYPVCENGKLLGVIRRSDILRALNENASNCYKSA